MFDMEEKVNKKLTIMTVWSWAPDAIPWVAQGDTGVPHVVLVDSPGVSASTRRGRKSRPPCIQAWTLWWTSLEDLTGKGDHKINVHSPVVFWENCSHHTELEHMEDR